jgi:hypothetical protein
MLIAQAVANTDSKRSRRNCMSKHGGRYASTRARVVSSSAFIYNDFLHAAEWLLIEQTQWIVVATTVATILWQRCSPFALAYLVGALSNARLSKILKRCIKQPRPQGFVAQATTCDVNRVV